MFRGKRSSVKAQQAQQKMDAIGEQLVEICKRNPGNLSRIQNLVESCPEAVALYKDSDGRTILHHLCSNGAPLEVVRFVVQAYPSAHSACRQVTKRGMMPLHYACRGHSTIDVIQLLLSHYPEALEQPTSSGWLPIHLACAKRASMEVVRLLVFHWPLSMQKLTPDGRTALHFACANKASTPVIAFLVQQWPLAVSVQDHAAWTPIHVACAFGVSLSSLQILVENWEKGLQANGHKGRIPLHVACWEGMSIDIIRYLVDRSPSSLWQRDDNNHLPLHLACMGKSSLAVVQFLILHTPATALEIGSTIESVGSYIYNRGNTREKRPVPDNLTMWLNRNVPALSSGSANVPRSDMGQSSSPVDCALVDQKTAGPQLHQACETPQALVKITDILAICPEAMEYKAYGGLRPIHTACLNEARLDVLMALTQQRPGSIRYQDDEGNLPIHLACYSGAPLKSIEFLVCTWPGSLLVANKSGAKPLSRAKDPFLGNPDPSVISFLESHLASTVTKAKSVSPLRTPTSVMEFPLEFRPADEPSLPSNANFSLQGMYPGQMPSIPPLKGTQATRRTSLGNLPSDSVIAGSDGSGHNLRKVGRNAATSSAGTARCSSQPNSPAHQHATMSRTNMATLRGLRLPFTNSNLFVPRPEASMVLPKVASPAGSGVYDSPIRPNESTAHSRDSSPSCSSRLSRTLERFDLPVSVDCGEIEKVECQPGAMAVKEPVARPDAAVVRLNNRHPSPMIRQDYRAAPELQYASTSRRTVRSASPMGRVTAQPIPPTFTEESRPSSFYKSAIEAALAGDNGNPQFQDVSTREDACGVARVPEKISSFYEAARKEAMGEISVDTNLADSNNSTTEDDRKPAAKPRAPSPTVTQQLASASSFYRSALEGAEQILANDTSRGLLKTASGSPRSLSRAAMPESPARRRGLQRPSLIQRHQTS